MLGHTPLLPNGMRQTYKSAPFFPWPYISLLFLLTHDVVEPYFDMLLLQSGHLHGMLVSKSPKN